MLKAEMLKKIPYEIILEMMLDENQVDRVKSDVQVFYQRKHGLPRAVLNLILIRTILLTGQKLFNEAYLRKTAETMKLYKITTPEQAIEYLENNLDNKAFLERSKRMDSKEPDWVEQYIQDLAVMKG